jgi:hypothetical protein
MLRDYNISGRINVVDIPVLMHMLQFWRVRLCLTVGSVTLNVYLLVLSVRITCGPEWTPLRKETGQMPGAHCRLLRERRRFVPLTMTSHQRYFRPCVQMKNPD